MRLRGVKWEDKDWSMTLGDVACGVTPNGILSLFKQDFIQCSDIALPNPGRCEINLEINCCGTLEFSMILKQLIHIQIEKCQKPSYAMTVILYLRFKITDTQS
ncbi:hypothetical protein AVEN_187469-1 [Araneus ventricosus]|uniref:Uncharacterized protein n=1 Tax=Araneus ventricosus TaxID=182803 RepID=A0A4Y2BU20_ARAVE|nr:hypothetical protein AVEN_187469-1 [Araneus ventricosus]